MRKFFVVLFVLASLLAACQPKAEQEATPLPPAEVEEPVVEEPTVEEPVLEPVVEEPVVEPVVEEPVVEVPVEEPVVEEPTVEEPVVEEPVVEPVVIAECPLKDQGLRIEFLGALHPEDGFYTLSSGMEQLASYVGCNALIEGRQVLAEEHHIWVFEGLAEWELPVREGSLWVYPIGWNMSDFSAAKPPIASEFVTAKRHNQLANDYDWVIYVHDGKNTFVFPAGQDTPSVFLPDNAAFSQPQPISVHGIWDGSSFNASIGAEKATTVALLDGELFSWVNARDNIHFSSIQAWTMPSSWSAAQVKAWAAATFPGQTLQEYAP